MMTIVVVGIMLICLAIQMKIDSPKETAILKDEDFELDPYLVREINAQNVDSVIDAYLLHQMDPKNYPPVPVIEARKHDARVGDVVYEMKIPETMPCDVCGNTLDLVSIEDGYSCRNKECLLHLKQEA